MPYEDRPILLFIPSPDDFRRYDGEDGYYCGLAEVAEEVFQIVKVLGEKLSRCRLEARRATIPQLSFMKRKAHGSVPEFVIQVGAFFASGAVTTLLLKLVSEWIKNRNGRRFHVRLPINLEVEATQLTKEQFEQLVKTIYECYCKPDADLAKGIPELKKLGFERPSDLPTKEEQELKRAYWEKREELRKALTSIPKRKKSKATGAKRPSQRGRKKARKKNRKKT